jgi:hypothetical protein
MPLQMFMYAGSRMRAKMKRWHCRFARRREALRRRDAYSSPVVQAPAPAAGACGGNEHLGGVPAVHLSCGVCTSREHAHISAALKL